MSSILASWVLKSHFYLLLVVSLEGSFDIGDLGRADGEGFDLQSCQGAQVSHGLDVLGSDELPQAPGTAAGEAKRVIGAQPGNIPSWRAPTASPKSHSWPCTNSPTLGSFSVIN